MWNEMTRMHARVFYTAEALGKLEELHTPIFREINVKGNALNTVDKIAAFFQRNTASAPTSSRRRSSFGVENKLQRADFLNRRYRIDSGPHRHRQRQVQDRRGFGRQRATAVHADRQAGRARTRRLTARPGRRHA